MVNVLHEFVRENLVMQLHQKLHSEILLLDINPNI